MKTAIALLLVLAVASAFGTFRSTADVYRSAWYIALLSAVSLNILICTINRFGVAWRRTFPPVVATTPEQISRMQVTKQFAVPLQPAEATSRIVTALKHLSYKVTQDQTEQTISIYAAKGRLRIWGPYLTHISVLVIIIGAIAGMKLGHGGTVIIPEGEVASFFYDDQHEKPLGFDVKLNEFRVVLDASGNPSAYKSDVEVLEKGKTVLRKVIDVNHPLTYKGVSLIQASYGPMVKLSFRTSMGDTTHVIYEVTARETEQGTLYDLADRMSPRTIIIGGKRLAVFMHDFDPNFGDLPMHPAEPVPDPAGYVYVNERYEEGGDIKNWKAVGWVSSERPAKYDGIQVSMNRIEYTKLDVSKNPALPALYAGFLMLLAGLYVSFYIRHRIIRAAVTSGEGGSIAFVGATAGAEAPGFEREFLQISKHLESES